MRVPPQTRSLDRKAEFTPGGESAQQRVKVCDAMPLQSKSRPQLLSSSGQEQ
jgi:hypothetical protein